MRGWQSLTLPKLQVYREILNILFISSIKSVNVVMIRFQIMHLDTEKKAFPQKRHHLIDISIKQSRSHLTENLWWTLKQMAHEMTSSCKTDVSSAIWENRNLTDEDYCSLLMRYMSQRIQTLIKKCRFPNEWVVMYHLIRIFRDHQLFRYIQYIWQAVVSQHCCIFNLTQLCSDYILHFPFQNSPVGDIFGFWPFFPLFLLAICNLP